MGRILIAWELGGHLGHLGRFVDIAKRFRELGHEPVFACRDLRSARIMLAPHAFTFLQAPVYRERSPNVPRPPRSYAEILHHYGYLDVRALSGLVMGWRSLLELVRPDLVLADYAPTALLATRNLGVPRATFGSGFFVPPETAPLPSLDPWQTIPAGRLERSDRLVLAAINQVVAEFDGASLGHLHELFTVDENFLTTYPELDHYGVRTDVRYWGAVIGPEGGMPPSWPGTNTPRIFGYVKSKYGYPQAVLETLRGIECSALLFMPDMPEGLVKQCSSEHVRVVREPLDIKRIAGECDLAITHAGHDTTAAMLLAGKPVIMLPLQIEQSVLARRVRDVGMGLIVLPREGKAGVRKGILKILSDKSYKQAAESFAEQHAGAGNRALLEGIVERCLELVAQGKTLRTRGAFPSGG